MNAPFIPIQDKSRGKWFGILSAIGIDRKHLTKKNGPCPFCGGVDRFRWTDHQGSGAYICNQCGHGSGADLVMRWLGCDFKTAAARIEAELGVDHPQPKSDERTDEQKRAAMRDLWNVGVPVSRENRAGQYLVSRGIDLDIYPASLRFVSLCQYDNIRVPAMLAKVIGPNGTAVQLHRTFLLPDGSKDRRMMPGALPPGSVIRLGPGAPKLGIAEGIETALMSSIRFGLPVWSAISEGNLQKFRPPVDVQELVIFGDADHSHVGQAASHILARDILREAQQHKRAIKLRVELPPVIGTDWADLEAAS